MAHNVKIRYYARENTKLKPHSFFAQPIPNGTYGFEQLCQEASENTTIEAHTIRAAVEEYMKVVQKKLCDGFRVEIGAKFITLGPGLTAKVKDELNDDGSIKKAVTAKDLTAVGARSRVTATVNPDFSYRFAQGVKWQKSDAQGNVIDEGEDITQDPDDTTDQTGGTSSGGTDAGGGTGGDMEP